MQGEYIHKNKEKEDYGDEEPSKDVVPDSEFPDVNTMMGQPWDHRWKQYVVSISTESCVCVAFKN